jgi:hypothetical protein
MEDRNREIIPTEKAIEILKVALSKAQKEEFNLEAWKSYTVSIFERIFGSHSKKIEEVEKIKIGSYLYDHPLNHRPQAIAILEAAILEIETLGVPIKGSYGNPGILINIQQTQELTFNLLKDAVKDELNGKQLREIQEIADSGLSPEDKKRTMLEKIKAFGSDIGSNILANILANPTLYQALF